MNKRIIIGISVLLLIFSYFVFAREDKIKNYPSQGRDIVAFGDSLIYGVGASSSETNFISLLSKKINKSIINLGVSGNTTSQGLSRIDELDRYNPKVVILLLGGNDYLQKVPIDTTFSNLEKIINSIQSRGSTVLLLGVRGGLITDKFEDRFEDLAEKTGSAYVPDVLDGLFGNSKFMSDSVHPNDLGYSKIYAKVYPELSKLIK